MINSSPQMYPKAETLPRLNDTSFAIHVDCDPLWVYAREYGLNVDRQDLIYRQALPAFLDLLDRFGVSATFFAIGQELAEPAFADFMRDAVARGHRIANHTLHHLPEFSNLDVPGKRAEIVEAHNRIAETVETPIQGFRAPGYAVDPNVHEILDELGYLYDSSVLPGPATLMMSVFYRLKGDRTENKSFAAASNFFASSRIVKSRSNDIFCIPISTIPFLRMPIHTTFIYQFGIKYGRMGLDLLSRTRGHHVLLFHAIDLLDHPIPGQFENKVIPMRWSFRDRAQLVSAILESVADRVCVTEELLATEKSRSRSGI